MTEGWKLALHACRTCGGRILEAGGTFRCATCGAASAGAVMPICGCGLVLARASGAELRHFRCGLNPNQGPQNPAEMVITFGSMADAGD